MAITLEEPKAMALPKETLEAFGGDELRARVFYEKYSLRDEQGIPIEKTPEELWQRVSKEISSVEKSKGLQDLWANRFYHLLENGRFVPGGRILFGAGQKRRATLLNCYVNAIREDSIESIFEWCKEAARTYSFGGGVGGDISILRPKGTPVNNSALVSTGAVSFMEIMSATTGTIGQAGRRGALMITINIDHPDVVDFISVKKDLKKVNYANISVKITDKFMNAVRDDTDFELQFKSPKVEMKRTIRARELWDKLIQSAWESDEPGVIFWDTLIKNCTTTYNNMMPISTNPCGEIPLEDGGCCCLGSINLSAFVINPFTPQAQVDMPALRDACEYATRFLDNVLDYNAEKHPLPIQKKASLWSRRIGVGVTGLGDMLIKLGIKYDTEDSLEFVNRLMNEIKTEVYKTSVGLAKEKGAFPAFNKDKHLAQPFIQTLPEFLRNMIANDGLRNAALQTVPPVGSGSILVGSSSGIEPVFAFKHKRRSKSLSQGEFEVVQPIIKEYEVAGGDIEKLPEYFVAAHQIDPHFRVRMQAAVQRNVDQSISSTVNLPQTISPETVGQIYFEAYEAGLKGITIYREGSREGILETDAVDKKTEPIQVTTTQSSKDFVRPQTMTGKTTKMRAPQGSLYITANQDEVGKIIEVFVELGKRNGEDKATAEAIGRLISEYLQNGGDISKVIKILRGIRGKNVIWDNGSQILSMPDAVGRALDIMTNGKKERRAHYAKAPPDVTPSGETCPECSDDSIRRENGCMVCESCGYSKCE